MINCFIGKQWCIEIKANNNFKIAWKSEHGCVLLSYILMPISSQDWTSGFRDLINADCTEIQSRVQVSSVIQSRLRKIVLISKVQLEEMFFWLKFYSAWNRVKLLPHNRCTQLILQDKDQSSFRFLQTFNIVYIINFHGWLTARNHNAWVFHSIENIKEPAIMTISILIDEMRIWMFKFNIIY